MISFLASILLTSAVILLLERQALPRRPRSAPFWRRPLLAVMPVVLFYFTLLMVSYRPMVSAVVSMTAFFVIIMLNNAKYRALREPLVFTDFALLKEVIRHPRLYVDYIGPWRLATLLAVSSAFLVGGLIFEPPLINRREAGDWMPSIVYLATVAGLIYAITRGPLRATFINLLNRFGPTLRVADDVADLSLLVCLICYFFLSNAPPPAPERRKLAIGRRAILENQPNGRVRKRPPPPDACIPDSPPDIVVVQSESFFDARRLGDAIDPSILTNFERLKSEARYYGRLEVPAWGANTMRTEYAFLSGMPNAALGYRRFNPYLALQNAPSWSFIHMLRLMGYVCVCIHPFDPAFFNRDKVFPNLGFYRFIGIDEFDGAERNGPYVSDIALARKIEEVLDNSVSPTFVFAITMENHGRWDPGRFGDEPGPDAAAAAPLGSLALEYYLRHLRNADLSLDKIARYLAARDRPGVMCVYGDHLPSLPNAFREAGFNDTDTDYLVWSTTPASGIEVDIAAEMLGRMVLDAALDPTGPVRRG